MVKYVEKLVEEKGVRMEFGRNGHTRVVTTDMAVKIPGKRLAA